MARETLTISCDTCSHEGTSACDDCVVSFLLGRDPADAIIIDAAEARAVRVFERGRPASSAPAREASRLSVPAHRTLLSRGACNW